MTTRPLPVHYQVNHAAASPWLRRSWSPNYSVLVWPQNWNLHTHKHISKVSLVSPLDINGCKVGHFQCNFLRLIAVALLFRRAAVNRPSKLSNGNVNFGNGKTDRILVPYSHSRKSFSAGSPACLGRRAGDSPAGRQCSLGRTSRGSQTKVTAAKK
jgi:hypothetical protein